MTVTPDGSPTPLEVSPELASATRAFLDEIDRLGYELSADLTVRPKAPASATVESTSPGADGVSSTITSAPGDASPEEGTDPVGEATSEVDDTPEAAEPVRRPDGSFA